MNAKHILRRERGRDHPVSRVRPRALREQTDRSADSQKALVLPLRQVGQADLDRAGGKGANLGELIRGGFPVPAGFVVTTAAYDRFVAHNGLSAPISQILAGQQASGAPIRDAFEAAPIPFEIEQAVLAAYQRLGGGAVAVRSSATAEDLPDAAFAGQQDTFLNVLGREPLLDSVRRCWASLWTDRAIAYRERRGLDQETVKLAVVVQRLVPAEFAGVLFTANPVTGAHDEIVVDANPGLGEAVVSGLVTPDHFVLRRRLWGWHIVEQQRGRREVVVRARAGGGTEHAGEQATRGAPALRPRALRRLAQLGSRIERHFGRPQDVEWAWANGRAFIVQARPITALPAPPSLPLPSWLPRPVLGTLAEMLAVRPYPLDVTVWGPGLFGAVTPIFTLVGLAPRPFEQVFVEDDEVVVQLRHQLPFRPTVGILLAPGRVLRLSRRYDPVDWRADPLVAEVRAQAHVLEERLADRRALSWDELLAILRASLAIPHAVGELRRRYFPRAALAAALLRLTLVLLGQADRFGALLSGVDTKTLEANRALERLAALIRSDDALAAVFRSHDASALWAVLEESPRGRTLLDELRAFLDEYGHRESVISTALRPTWKDAPEAVLGILQGLAQATGRPAPARPAWEAARDALLTHPLLRLPPLHSAWLKRLAEGRCLTQIREDTHFYATLALPVIRRAALACGQQLADAGVLDAPEDVFHLRLRELEGLGRSWTRQTYDDLRALARRRKERRAALEGTPLIPTRYFRRGEAEGDVAAGAVLLRGSTGSPGLAAGPARVIHDSSEFGKLLPGEVLVAPYTNPAWTPLFQRAVAVVVDTGSVASHAAIVAREYGIPAVMGTGDGTTRLRDGQQVAVDGNRGLVADVSISLPSR